MSTENNNRTPRLRFPGFTGEWEVKKMSDVFTRITEKNVENNKNVLTISAQYGLISQLDFFKKSVSAADVTGYYLLHEGDFAYNKSSSQGKPVGAIKPLKRYDKGVVSTLYICFRCKDPNAVSFWDQYFDSGVFDNEIMTIAQEGARNHGLLNVPNSDFFDLNVLMPCPAEQKKIAECLTEIDNLIAAQSENVDALKEEKKGLMQQLFPQDGETTPRLRFPGFDDEWEEKKLGDVGSFIRGLSYNNSEVTQDSSSTLVIRSNNIIPDSIVDCKNGLVFVTKAPSEEQILRKGDVVICLANGSSNLVGKSSSFNGDYSGIITVGAFCGIYRSELPICRYLIQTATYKEKINIIKQGGDGSLANLYGKDILGLAFYFPSQEEQNKIVECLSALDDQIAAESAKLEALKDHKRGLMQQLFPQPDNK